LVAAFFRRRLRVPNEIIRKTFFANPFDSDWGQSIQAGRFFTYTDAARWEVAVRIGFLKGAIKNKWVIIMGGQKIIHRRPVRIFRRFTMTIQIVGWDDKWMYAAHAFRQGEELKCVTYSKIGLRGKRGLVSPIEAFHLLGHPHIAPASWVLKHFETDVDAFREADRLLPGRL
jgi:acyl-CoA thioesterase FadM